MSEFEKFCHFNCDRLYSPGFPDDLQCTGYIKLKDLLQSGDSPASEEECLRWETQPTLEELVSIPPDKYLRFLHPLLRPLIIREWHKIKLMTI